MAEEYQIPSSERNRKMQNAVDRVVNRTTELIKEHQIPSCIRNKEMHNAIDKVVDCQIKNIMEKAKDQMAAGVSPAVAPDVFRFDILRQECGSSDIAHIMETAGGKFVGSGSNRTVWQFGECVVKVAKDIGSRESDFREETVWDSASPEIRQYLAPVIDAGFDGEYITMPYVSKPPPGKRDEYVMKLFSELHKADFTCQDLSPDNVGEYEGRPVILDYGFGISSCRRR